MGYTDLFDIDIDSSNIPNIYMRKAFRQHVCPNSKNYYNNVEKAYDSLILVVED
jgi:hypothetical protein